MPGRNARFTYTPEDHEYLTFAWEGGPYIDIFVGEDEFPRETIHVWDYGTDRPRIPVTSESFIAECEEWQDWSQ